MNAQQQAVLNSGEQSAGASKKAHTAQQSTDHDAAAREPSDAARERLKFWTGENFNRMTAAKMVPSIEACFTMFDDWCQLSRSAAEQIEEDMQFLRQGWLELSKCEAPNELAKAGAELREKFTQQCAKSTQKLAALAGDYATRRWRTGVDLAATLATVKK